MTFPWELPLWSGVALVVALGTCVVVGGAAIGARLARSAVWQRAFWQVSILGILTLLAAEATGISTGIVQWWHVHGVARQAIGVPVARRADELLVSFRVPDAVAGPRASLAVGGVSVPGFDVTTMPPGSELPAVVNVGQTEIPVSSASDRMLLASVSGLRGNGEPPGILSTQTTADEPPSLDATDSHPLSRDRSFWDAGWGLVWTLGAALLLIRLAGIRWRLQRFRHGQRRLDHAELQDRVERLAGRLGLRRRIGILESPRLAGPIAFGVVRPVIVLPTGFLSDFDLRQQDAMLAHELAHLAAGDPVWQLLADAAAALLWWHPLVWWSRRQWRAAGELAADEASLLVPQGADTLAACLVELARRMASGPPVVGLAMAGPGWRSALGRRVERLLDLSSRTWRPPRRGQIRAVTGTVAVALLLVAVSCTAWARTGAPAGAGVTTRKVFADGWRQSLVAVTLAAVLGPASGGDDVQTPAAGAERHVPRTAEPRDGDRGEAPHANDSAPGHGEPQGARRGSGATKRGPSTPAASALPLKANGIGEAPRERAERPDRGAHELTGMLEQRTAERPAVRSETGEAQRRLQHLQAAIEHLRAAGWHAQADELAREAGRLARGERSAALDGARRPEAARPVPGAAPQLERALQELRGQIQDLRHQLEEMRQQLKDLDDKR